MDSKGGMPTIVKFFGSANQSEAHQNFKELALIAEETENYEDMLDFVRFMLDNDSYEYSFEQIQLIDNGYRIRMANLRAEIRGILALEQNTNPKTNGIDTKLSSEYRKEIYQELQSLCREAREKINMIEQKRKPDSIIDPRIDGDKKQQEYVLNLLKSKTGNAEGKKVNDSIRNCDILLKKMKADYLRYELELCTDAGEKAALITEARRAYEIAYDMVKKDLDFSESKGKPAMSSSVKLNPLSLSILLNLAIFAYENSSQPFEYRGKLQETIIAAMPRLSAMDDKSSKEVCAIIQLMRDNLAMWSIDNKKTHLKDDKNAFNTSFEGVQDTVKTSKTNIS